VQDQGTTNNVTQSPDTGVTEPEPGPTGTIVSNTSQVESTRNESAGPAVAIANQTAGNVTTTAELILRALPGLNTLNPDLPIVQSMLCIKDGGSGSCSCRGADCNKMKAICDGHKARINVSEDSSDQSCGW
jgi:hypothetical protein